MKEFTTHKGTVLPMLTLKGKPYLQIAHRIVWFREEHPHGSIQTTPVEIAADHAVFRAEIRDKDGRLLASSHKSETTKGFPDFIEKSETGSIGRALALCGYGTQFCSDELDEGDRLADAPVQHKPTPGHEIFKAPTRKDFF